ncbi:MAG: FapA family protein [Pelovirga sp.]
MAASDKNSRIDVGCKVLAEYVTDDYSLKLQTCDSDLECRAGITVHNLEKSPSPADIISILRRNNITSTVDLEQVAIFCTEAAQGNNPQEIILARGVEPEPGEDGWFELIVSTGKDVSEWEEDEYGRVDFKAVQNFSNVDVDEHIGNIHPPTTGEAGKSITGDLIPPLSGKPANIVAGPGVRFSDDGKKALAARSGRPIFDKNIISIAEEFVVNGDVDLTIGHITFNGFVDIKGDVLDDFNITATKGIKVSGAVGACKIQCDGPVTIGTMSGKGVGKIICKGTLRARYLNQVTVECWSDVHISHEARNTVIKSTGSIHIEAGQVSGGETIALEGIEVKAAGARSGIRTHLISGVYFPETDRLKYLRTRVKSVAEQVKRINEVLKSLNKKPLPANRPALREAIELRIGILTQRHVNLEEEREELNEELVNFSAGEHPTARAKINIMSTLYEGTVIHLGEAAEEIQMERSGPVTVVENMDNGSLRYLDYSPLPMATDIPQKDPQEADTL